MEYIAFEIGRGGPKGKKVPSHALCTNWNVRLLKDRAGVSIRAGWGSTGNYIVTSSEALTISQVSVILDGLPRARSFVVFSAIEFTDRLFRFEAYIERAGQPQVPVTRRPNPGVVMDRDLTGGVAPHIPAADPANDPVEDSKAWTSSGFGVARVRGVWKNDLVREGGRVLDRVRREGTWGALAAAMSRAHGGEWTARAIRTLRGLAQSLDPGNTYSATRRGVPTAIDRLIKDRREAILNIAAKHGATNVRVFGSVARGTSTSASDLDLLVDAGPHRSPFFPGGLIAELEDTLGLKVDVLTEGALHWYIRDRVLQEAVPL